MKKIIISFLLVILIVLSFKFYNEKLIALEIEQIASFNQALCHLEKCDVNSLVIFDIDDTIITSEDALARDTRYPLCFKLKAYLKYPQLLNEKEKEYFYSIMFESAKRFVFEPEIINIINNLKKSGCIVLALTALETGTFGVINDIVKWRYLMLKDLGIEFSTNFKDTIFKKLPSIRGNYPILYNGIIFCNTFPKGKVLEAFLHTFNLHPQTIIYFDDYKYELVRVAKACKKEKIKFKGFLCLQKKNFVKQWDNCRSLKQLDYLIKHKSWLTDKQADLMPSYIL